MLERVMLHSIMICGGANHSATRWATIMRRLVNVDATAPARVTGSGLTARGTGSAAAVRVDADRAAAAGVVAAWVGLPAAPGQPPAADPWPPVMNRWRSARARAAW